MAADGPISPELILVSSPEEAERARALLPALPAPPPRRQQQPPPPTVEPQLLETPPPVTPPPRRARTWLLAVAGVLVLVVVGVDLWASLGKTSKPPPAARPRARSTAPAAGAPASKPKPKPTTAPTPTSTRPAAVAPASKPTTTAPAATTTAPAPATTTAPQPKTPAPAFVPARLWLWQRADGVAGYLFELTLNGKRVVVARTKDARYALPKSFRFRAGTYRWTVRSLPLTKAPPLTDSRFVVTPESAALANP